MFSRFEIRGVGLHTGEPAGVIAAPGDAGSGVVFISRGAAIPAVPENLIDEARLCTTLLADGRSVQTVEHLLAAVAAVGLRDVRITLDGPEVPILDGSAMPWYRALLEAGASPGFHLIPIHREFTVRSRDASARIRPVRSGEVPSISINTHFRRLGESRGMFRPTEDAFETIAAARTFAFEEELTAIFEAGLAKGGSLENALVIGDDGPLNPGGLRFPDEPLRHKMVDVIGDLSLVGGLLKARIDLFKPGHHLIHALVRTLATHGIC